MKVINLFGGPCTGKTTAAAGLFYEMKKLHLNVELVLEYAKDAVYEKRANILNDQLYILAKQNRRIARLKEHGIEWVVSDSPVIMGLAYLKEGVFSDNFTNFVAEVFNPYMNFNYLLQRHHKYNPIGRNQNDEKEAKVFDAKVTDILSKHSIPFDTILGGESAVERIMSDLNFSAS